MPHITEDKIIFAGKLTSPLKLTITCTAKIDGDSMTEEPKAAMVPRGIPFTAIRRTA